MPNLSQTPSTQRPVGHWVPFVSIDQAVWLSPGAHTEQGSFGFGFTSPAAYATPSMTQCSQMLSVHAAPFAHPPQSFGVPSQFVTPGITPHRPGPQKYGSVHGGDPH